MNFRALRVVALTAALVLPLPARSNGPHDLTFDERVRAQEAIERVYYSHQIGATRPFQEAVPRHILEKKVRTYLKQTVALEEFWKTTVTSAALQRELERIAAGTRFPERLEEIYRALGHDPNLILECLARPVLVDRLSRNFFATDKRIHAAAREEVESLRLLLVGGSLEVAAEHPRRQILELRQVEGLGSRQQRPSVGVGAPPDSDHSIRRLEVEPEDFKRWRERAPRNVGEIGPVVEERDAFVLAVVLAQRTGSFHLGIYRIPKVSWDEWWVEVLDTLDESRVPEVGPPRGRLSVLVVARGRKPSLSRQVWSNNSMSSADQTSPSCVPDDTWDNGVLDDLPKARSRHTLVWTGNHMVVWGGGGSAGLRNDGGRYDPVLDTWTAMSTIDAPQARERHTAVWTGSEMIVWGGLASGSNPTGGGRYDPLTDSWRPTSTVGVPTGRFLHTAVWTGSEMIIWGGTTGTDKSGGRYDPASDTWRPTSIAGLVPSARGDHTAVWTGNRMIVWGGWNSSGAALNTGALYDPVTNIWTSSVSTADVPEARGRHTAVWTGSEMVVWGGGPQYGNLNTGGRYDPAANTWTATSTLGAPEERNSHAAVWTGSEMIVWGGQVSFVGADIPLDSGGRYNTATDSWALTSVVNTPSPRVAPALWTGSLMIVWGSHGTFGSSNTGGRYDPATDTWTPTSTLKAPSSGGGKSVWTGTVMIAWDGRDPIGGSRYDPLTDTWTPTSSVNAPSLRSDHAAVWTGNEMIVWGGGALGPQDFFNTGGRYDPVTDSWIPTSTTNAPEPRTGPTAVWTGNEMIVWGGRGGVRGDTRFNTGGRYDPATDTWVPTSTSGAPSPRVVHTSVWTGREMIVWGGDGTVSGGPLIVLDTGGRYDPLTDTWRPTTTSGAPTARELHTAVWTGDLMIIWGGSPGGLNWLNSGGRYDPTSDMWTPVSEVNATQGRASHTAVWTGREMIVWGGSGATAGTGGRYDPVTEAWISTSTVNAPVCGVGHTAVWTGSFMIIWGCNGGGRYALGQSVDDDGDGLSECAGDCNDTNPQVWSAPVEVTGMTMIGGSPTTFGWDDQNTKAGPETQYEVVSGSLAGTGTVDFTSSSCLQMAPVTTYSDPRPDPVPGSAYWYLVRARNSCGLGTYGTPERDQGIPPCP